LGRDVRTTVGAWVALLAAGIACSSTSDDGGRPSNAGGAGGSPDSNEAGAAEGGGIPAGGAAVGADSGASGMAVNSAGGDGGAALAASAGAAGAEATMTCEHGAQAVLVPSGGWVCDCPAGTWGSACELGTRQVVFGHNDACALRDDGTIACWGAVDSQTGLDDGRVRPPAGKFSSLTLPRDYGCALKPDQTVACWGSGGSAKDTSPPPDQFLSIAAGKGAFPPAENYAGVAYTCGIKADNTIGCWGTPFYGLLTPPPGQFTALGAGAQFACAIRTDKTLACWGQSDPQHPISPPQGTFADVDVGGGACGVLTSGKGTCWGFSVLIGQPQPPPPAGELSRFNIGASDICGTLADGSVTCTVNHTTSYLPAPPAKYTDVAVGDLLGCGVTVEGTVNCWGASGRYEAPPSGLFSELTVGGVQACGLTLNGGVECWNLGLDAPRGAFSSIVSSDGRVCGLHADGTVECWGYTKGGGPYFPSPEGKFKKIALGGSRRYTNTSSYPAGRGCGIQQAIHWRAGTISWPVTSPLRRRQLAPFRT